MALDKITTAEVEALLRLLADMEREELELISQERHEAERQDWPYCLPDRLSRRRRGDPARGCGLHHREHGERVNDDGEGKGVFDLSMCTRCVPPNVSKSVKI